MRLIDAEPYMADRIVANEDDKGIAVKSIPTVDAKPTKHGYWINEEICSVCNDDIYFMLCGDIQGVEIELLCFCPNCGAKMDKEKE